MSMAVRIGSRGTGAGSPVWSHVLPSGWDGLLVAGVDEAGRGPLAGPVAAAAVILDPTRVPAGLDDSKRLPAAERERLFDLILDGALATAVALSPPALIDRINIRAATLRAMAQAVAGLALAPGGVLVDGRDVPPGLAVPGCAVVGGDGLVPAIQAASILAKVTRDRLMARLAQAYPAYGFERHKGYATARHLAALRAHGPSPHHRLSFAPVRAAGGLAASQSGTLPPDGPARSPLP